MNLYLIGSRETYVIVNWVSIEVRERATKVFHGEFICKFT